MESQHEIIAFVAALPGVLAETASARTGAPEVAWGDTFFFHDPDGDTPADRRMPFATIVTKDYDGFDTASDLNRPGVFRLNIAVGRAAFEELLGEHLSPPADVDYTALDTLLPHPVYAAQSWVAILNPGERTAEPARKLLTGAHARAVRAYQRRTARGRGAQR
ncbi:DUF6194 family protein [Actinoallomurus sp. NBC_01490]|uniref:DUF6194 family protein n=1 Tax=Actinoallomurus sp. NBC_01490 TaxID=2903557 RepID=UPI002E31B7A2|nr:DUF6194 family protein [Actinoallomurus sp. NBC_01490]